MIPIDFGHAIGDIAGRGDFNIDFSGGNGFNLFNTQQLLTDTEALQRQHPRPRYQLSDNIRLFGEGWYTLQPGHQPARPAGV